MRLSRISPFIIVPSLVLALYSCESGGVGDPCIPEDEYRADFSGFAQTESNVESRSFQCETRVCLVNNFRGRVSCPYGQNVDGFDAVSGVDPNNAQGACRIPGTGETISVPVNPQLTERRPDDAVYCSCRCDGPDPNAKYCDCPDGFECHEVVPDFGLGKEQLAGSYCVRAGKFVDNPTRLSKQGCSWDDKDCGDTNTADF